MTKKVEKNYPMDRYKVLYKIGYTKLFYYTASVVETKKTVSEMALWRVAIYYTLKNVVYEQ